MMDDPLDLWSGQYVLDCNGNPIPERDLLTWARWYEGANRRIALTEFAWGAISTVFLGIDHNFFGRAEDDPLGHKPVLWETMVFKSASDDEQAEWEAMGLPPRHWGKTLQCLRYASRADAVAGHYSLVEQYQAEADSQDDKLQLDHQGARR